MSVTMIAVLVIALAVVFLVLRMPIAFAFGATGFLGIVLIQGFRQACTTIQTVPFSQIGNYSWSTLPLYILMGYLAYQSKLTENFFAGARSLVGHLRGGLLHAVIVGNIAFGACCGVSLAAASSFTSITLPEARKYGYNDKYVVGVIAGSSALSVLIPPSTSLIIFGCLTLIPVSQLFIAGIIPGIVLAVLFVLTAWVISKRNPEGAPVSPEATRKQKLIGLVNIAYFTAIFAFIIGGLYLGVFTPTEGAGIGCVVVVILGLIRRTMKWEGIKRAVCDTIDLSVVILFLLTGIKIFNSFLSVSGVTILMIKGITRIANTPLAFLLLVAVIMLILGMFIDTAPMTVLFVPLLFPVAEAFGISPLQFGVMFVCTGIIGGMTPPFGIVVYTMARLVPELPLWTIFKAGLPYLAMMGALLLLVIFVPGISTALPGLMAH
jgi:tripartite ATP-independent transporter DctM subunit